MCKTRTRESALFWFLLFCFFQRSDPSDRTAPSTGVFLGSLPGSLTIECVKRVNGETQKQDNAQTFCISCLSFPCCCSPSSGPSSASLLTHLHGSSVQWESSTLQYATIPLMYRYYRDEACGEKKTSIFFFFFF